MTMPLANNFVSSYWFRSNSFNDMGHLIGGISFMQGEMQTLARSQGCTGRDHVKAEHHRLLLENASH